ncbi:MAG: ferritin family protein [Desulfobacterales bacterium]|nr:ferritin family protein [Desulfobacterales bacterium]
MKYDFSADDVFEMAEQLERNGAQFYRQAAAGVSGEEAKRLLNELAAMEDDHEQIFAAMRAELAAGEKAETVFDPENEAAAYLRALADTKVFFEKKIDTSSLREILKDAITAEKDSIVFYLGMREMVPQKLGKERLDAIIREEMGHVRLLSKHLVAEGK